MTYSYPVTINGRWTLRLPPHRAVRYLDEQTWEKERLASMFLNIASNDYILDVGAEEGDMSALFASWVHERGDVYLMEPNPKSWPSIKAVWDANPGLAAPWATFVGFASDETANVPGGAQWLDKVRSHHGWPDEVNGPVDPEHGFRHLAQETDTTAQVTVDQFCRILSERTEGFHPPTVITIDVEGSELRVLQGARRTLGRHRPLVWVSVHPQFMPRGHTSEFFRFMDEMEYRVTHLADDHEAHYFCEPR